MNTTIHYPIVIRELLEALDCSIDLEGCNKSFHLLRVYDLGINDELDNEIADHALSSKPKLVPLVERFRDEGGDFSTLCYWLEGFIEDASWLTGNRPWPVCEGIFVKNIDGRRFGTITLKEGVGRIVSRDDKNISWSYPTAFDALLDGWKVD